MGASGVLAIITSVIKTVFCSSSYQYQTDSIDCYASFGGIVLLNSNGKGM